MEMNVFNFYEDRMQNVACIVNKDKILMLTMHARRTKCDHNSSPCTSCIGELIKISINDVRMSNKICKGHKDKQEGKDGPKLLTRVKV